VSVKPGLLNQLRNKNETPRRRAARQHNHLTPLL